MQALKRVAPVVMSEVLLAALAADESKVNAATQHVETGAKQVGQGEIGKGVAFGSAVKNFFTRLFSN